MKLNTYLSFDGNCEAAINFYAKALGGTVQMALRYGDSPEAANMPAKLRDKLMHGCVAFGNDLLMGTDATPDHPYKGVVGCSVSVNLDTPAEVDRAFKALAENGKVEMPPQQTFWSPRFGMLIDQFGVSWMVGCAPAA